MSRNKPVKKDHCHAAGAVEQNVVDRTGARGFEALVKFVSRRDEHNENDGEPEAIVFYKIYRGCREGPDGEEGQDRVFGKVSGFSDEGVIGGDGRFGCAGKQEFQDGPDDPGRFGHRGLAERKAKDNGRPQKKRRVCDQRNAPF